MPTLTRPHVRFKDSFLEAMDEFAAEGRAGEESMIGWDLDRFGDTWDTDEGFASYVVTTLAEAEHPRKPGFVCQTSWWWTEGHEYLGRISLRHELNDHLLQWGGHIGYDVRRSRRREGHATRMLAAVLVEAAGLGIDPVLLTCEAENTGSRRVIETNGGVLEDQRGPKLRYWVPTTRKS
jgi:predicted acetyltransferase